MNFEVLLRLQQYGYWSHSPGTLVAPVEGRLGVEFMRESVPRGFRGPRDTDLSTESQSQKEVRPKERREGPRETTSCLVLSCLLTLYTADGSSDPNGLLR